MSFFTEANRVRAKGIVARYPRAKSAILPLAHLAQDQLGWLSPEAMGEIAELVGVTAADVQGTCSFYTMLKRRPCGKLVVSVCTNVTCLVTGGPEVLEHLEARYAADPDVTEEWKWRGVPVWSHDGIICTGETYKAVVKMTFAKGASLKDPAGLFNASLEGNMRRAIDFHEGDTINGKALKALIRAAVTLNQAKSKR